MHTAPNHRSHPSHLQFQGHQWMSVPLKAGTQRIPQLTMPHSTLMMSTEGSTGIFRRATPSTPTSQELCLSFRALPPLRRLHEDKKGN